jgi:hypothetical protein
VTDLVQLAPHARADLLQLAPYAIGAGVYLLSVGWLHFWTRVLGFGASWDGRQNTLPDWVPLGVADAVRRDLEAHRRKREEARQLDALLEHTMLTPQEWLRYRTPSPKASERSVRASGVLS